MKLITQIRYVVFIIFLTLILFFIWHNVSQNRKTANKCYNIILVSLDTTRADHLGCYGYFRDTSPAIDNLAKESTVFRNAFSQSSHTLSSHMSIFTSLYPSSHGIYLTLKDTLNVGLLTLAQVLKMNNYATVWAGEISQHLSLEKGFGRGFEYFIDIKDEKKAQFGYWEDGFKWLRENKDKKFFMFLHTFKIHAPYTPQLETVLKFTDAPNKRIIISEEELYNIAENKIILDPSIIFKKSVIKANKRIFNNKLPTGKSFNSLLSDHSNLHKTFPRLAEEVFWENIDLHNNDDMDYIRLLYDAEIYEADRAIKHLIDLLKEEGLMNKTILIITSDHGEEFMEHGGIRHGITLYDEVIHVPLILWVPWGNSGNGKEIFSLVESIDIMPTILDLVGIPVPRRIEGASLVPLIDGRASSLHKYVFSETLGNLVSIRSRDWKYITNFKDSEELYNLRRDNAEKSNEVYAEPKIRGLMRKQLEEYFNKSASYRNHR